MHNIFYILKDIFWAYGSKYACFREIIYLNSVADPGFLRGGGTNPRGGGAPTYDFAKFSKKMHEIERIWTRGHPSPPLDPPMKLVLQT